MTVYTRARIRPIDSLTRQGLSDRHEQPEQNIHRVVVQHLRARAQQAALKILLRRLRKRAEDKASWYII